jgi:hypothetical protein
MDAVANLYLYSAWKSNEFEAVPWQTIPIYGPIVVKSSSNVATRDLHTSDGQADLLPWEVPEDALPNPLFGRPDLTELYSAAPAEDSMMISANLYNHTDLELPHFSNVTAWGISTYARGINLLHRRADGKENEFSLGDFKCTTGGNSPCSVGLSGASKVRREEHMHHHGLKHTHGRHGIAKRAGSPAKVLPLEARATPSPAPVVNDCGLTLPRLYYNCVGMFADSALQGPTGNTVTIPGICTSVRRYLTNHGINTDQLPLNYDNWWSSQRNTAACGTSVNPCPAFNTRYKATLGITIDPTNCDEAPMAKAEEGGLGWNTNVHPADPLGATRTCVPRWQNSAQGVCHGTVLFHLSLICISVANRN